MRNLKTMALGALLIFWGGVLQAAPPLGIYEAEVVVTDQGRKTRAEAMAEAMAAVLLKATGRASVLEEEVIQGAMADASRYVQQYRYRSEDAPNNQVATRAEQRLWLWVSFDHGSIDNLLRRFGFSVWSAARPSILTWLALDEGTGRQLVGANDKGLVREVVEAEAQRRAIPVRLPLLDLSDQSRIRPADVWGGFIDNIESASARYESEAVLIGKLYRVGKEWEARWILLYQGERHEWQYADKDVSKVVASGVGGSAEYLSTFFAATNYLGQDQLALNISAVSSMAGFRRVNDYLLSLHGVKAVKLRRVDADSASFLLEIEGGRETVLHAIHKGDVLVEVAAPPLAPQSLAPERARQGDGGGAAMEVAPTAVEELAAASVAETGGEEALAALVAPAPELPIVELYFRLLP